MPPGVPESFKVLVKELQSLALAVEVINQEERVIEADRVREVGEEEIDGELLENDIAFPVMESTSVIESAGFTVEGNEDSLQDNEKEQE